MEKVSDKQPNVALAWTVDSERVNSGDRNDVTENREAIKALRKCGFTE